MKNNLLSRTRRQRAPGTARPGPPRSQPNDGERTARPRTQRKMRPAPEPMGRLPRKAAHANIRPYYRLHMLTGLALSLLLLTALFRAPFYGNDEAFEVNLTQQEVVEMEEVVQTEQITKPPPPPRPPVPVEVPNDEIIEDDLLDLDASLDIDEPLASLPPPPPPPPEEEVVEVEEEIFVVVEQMPEIIGGQQRIYELLEYPEIARQAGLEGLVVIQIVVETDGRPTQPTVARSAGPVLDDAAVAAVMQLRFKPGLQRQRPVRVRMAIPIRFRLRNTKSS